VRWLQPSVAVSWDDALLALEARQDGFGFRRFEHDDNWGRVELLELSPPLSTPAAEQAIRARAARFINGRLSVVAPLYSIARAEDGVSIVSGAPEGVTLADVLAALEFGTIRMSDGVALELAGMAAQAVAAMHETGTFAHAALTPAHVLLRVDGTMLLTGAVFGDALQALRRNREQFWREFGVALPPLASLPRFDHRSDVTQLGALVLAILLRRSLTPDEYPRAVNELVNTAVDRLHVGAVCGGALRQWLQQTFQLHAKSLFASAVDAERSYAAIVEHVSGRRGGAVTIRQTVREMLGHPPLGDAAPVPTPERPHRTAASASVPTIVPAVAESASAGSRGKSSFLRSVLPSLGLT
jgi:hypothetical protein